MGTQGSNAGLGRVQSLQESTGNTTGLVLPAGIQQEFSISLSVGPCAPRGLLSLSHTVPESLFPPGCCPQQCWTRSHCNPAPAWEDSGIPAGILLSSFPKAKCSSQRFPFEVQTPQSEPQTFSREKGSGHESLVFGIGNNPCLSTSQSHDFTLSYI